MKKVVIERAIANIKRIKENSCEIIAFDDPRPREEIEAEDSIYKTIIDVLENEKNKERKVVGIEHFRGLQEELDITSI